MNQPDITPSGVFSTISRYLKQRELNRIHERLAELGELLDYWCTKVNIVTGGIPEEVVYSVSGWRAKRAKLLVRRDRLEKELGVSTTP